MKSTLKFCRLGLPTATIGLLIALLLGLLLTATVVQAAAPLLDENFNYGTTAGSLTLLTTNWTAHSGVGSGLVGYAVTSLSMPAYASSGVGGSATFVGGSGSREDVNRVFGSEGSGILYYAALVNLTQATTTGDYFMSFLKNTTTFAARLYAKDNGSGKLRFGIASVSSATYNDTTDFSYNTTYLVVVKYNIDTGYSALYVLDTCIGTEPGTALATSSGTATTPIIAIAIRQGSNVLAGTIDGIRVATTWADAAKCGPVLTLAKSASPNTDVAYHGEVTYTLTLTNVGGADDTTASVTDTLPAEVSFARWVKQPAGATESNDEITWSGTVTASEAITFTFIVTHVGDYGDVVINTAEFSGTTITGTAQAGFTVEQLAASVTFVYHDLEDVVHTVEPVYIAGDFNGWDPAATPMTADAGSTVFSVTVPSLVVGDTYEYKYVVNSGGVRWNWLQGSNRSVTIAGDATVNDYRDVAVGYAKLQWPPTLQTKAFHPTDPVYGRVYIDEVTNPTGEGRSTHAQVGYGVDLDPAAWTWFPMTYNTDDGGNDEFMGVITPTAGGVYSYAVRFDGNWGLGNPNAGWTYGDLDGYVPSGPGADPFELAEAGVLTVITYDVEVVKTVTPTQVLVADGAGSLVTYTIAITNLSTLTDTTTVTLTDLLPQGFVYVADTCPVDPESTAPLVWVFTDPIEAGEGLTCTLVVSATDAITRSGLYTNRVTVTVDPPDWVAANNTGSAGVMVYRILPIAEARQRPADELVAIEGTVTVEPGVFTYNGMPRYMYIQDDTGGVLIYRYDPGLSAVARHHRVRVIGARGEYRAETQVLPVNATDVTDLGLSTPIVPAPTDTGAVDEDVEGQLLQVEGCIVGKPAAYRLQVDDGSGVVEVYRYYNLGTPTDPNYIDTSSFLVGGYLWAAGVSRGYQETGYGLTREVLPRGPADIAAFAPSAGVTKQVTPSANVKPGSVVTYTITLDNGGDGRILNAVITDTLPIQVTFGGWVKQPAGAIQAGGAITWTGDVTEPVQIVFTATVGAGMDLYGKTITNTVTVASGCAGSDQATAAFTTMPLYRVYLPIVAKNQ
jgi:uncharacterized repeat protein (TIGR01451 family)